MAEQDERRGLQRMVTGGHCHREGTHKGTNRTKISMGTPWEAGRQAATDGERERGNSGTDTAAGGILYSCSLLLPIGTRGAGRAAPLLSLTRSLTRLVCERVSPQCSFPPMSDGPSPRGGDRDRDPSDARSLRPLSLSLAGDSPSRTVTLSSPSHAPLLLSSPSKIRAQQQMTLSAIPEAAPVTNDEQQQQQQYAASAASASAAAASAIAAAASPFESGNGGLPPLSPSQPHSPSVAAPDGSMCTTPVSTTSTSMYPRAGTLARSSTTPDSASGPGSAGRATLGVPSGYGTMRMGSSSSSNGLTPAAPMGSRQPSAPTTPAANPRLMRPLSSSRSAHSSPAHGGNGTLPPMGPGGPSLLRRPSVSLLPSAGELGSPDVSLSRAPSANGAVSALGMPVMHEPSAFARPDAMISYSRKDIAFVRLLYQHFENAGRSIWVDFNNIPKVRLTHTHLPMHVSKITNCPNQQCCTHHRL